MKTSIATVSLSGDLTTKLEAIAAAGFDGYELFENDLTFSNSTPAEIRARSTDLGLQLYALQPFRDFEGLLDARRSAVFGRAERKFDLMEVLGTDRLLIPSSVSPHAADHVGRIVDDLRELGERAARRGFRVGYEALAWGRHVRDWTAAWAIVEQVDHPAVGLVLDTYHLFVRGNPIGPIRDVPADKITLVQLADAPSLDMEVLRHSRHLRNFPGQGDYPIVDFLRELVAIGYDDVISHEIFNDDFRIAPPEQTAIDGHRSMLWLREQLGNGDPLPAPSADGVAYIEFGAPDPDERRELDDFFTRIGFTRTHRHRHRPVDLYRLGDACLLIDGAPTIEAGSLSDRQGAASCTIGLTAERPDRALARADAYRAGRTDVDQPGGDGDAPPVVVGVGGMAHHLIGPLDHPTVNLDSDFEALATTDAEEPGPVVAASARFDHLGIAVAPHELLSALLFYRTVLGFDRLPMHELVDPHGLVTSRAVESPTGAIRLALTTSAGSDTSPERFRSATQGSGVQHIAIAADPIDDLAATIDPALVLSIPDNYYADLESRFRLDPERLAFLRDHNILYDETDDGSYLHLYTREIHGVFFEFVERRSYRGFGAANAPVRLAAQARTAAYPSRA